MLTRVRSSGKVAFLMIRSLMVPSRPGAPCEQDFSMSRKGEEKFLNLPRFERKGERQLHMIGRQAIKPAFRHGHIGKQRPSQGRMLMQLVERQAGPDEAVDDIAKRMLPGI